MLIRTLLQATRGSSQVAKNQLPKRVQDVEFVRSLEAANLLEPAVESDWIFSGFAKVQLAIRALQLGEATRPILKALTWQEFEEFVAQVCSFHEFQIVHRFRFSLSRRYEIDIVAKRQPCLLCIDCKQFGVRSGKASTLRSASEKQLARTQALANHISRYQADLSILDWQKPILLPVLVTMMLEDIQFHENIPIVPAVKLNAFLLRFEQRMDQLQKVEPSNCRQTKLF